MRFRHYHYAGALLATIVVALSCGRSSDETTHKAPPASSAPRQLESDFVGFGGDDDAREKVIGEQSFQPQEAPPPTTLPPKRAKRITVLPDDEKAKVERRAEDEQKVTPREPQRVPPPELPQYNPRTAVVPPPQVQPQPQPQPPRPSPLAPIPPRDDREDRNRFTPSDVAVGVGTASMITGAAAAAAGDGTDGSRIFGISMLGLGLASYATAGVLSLQEDKSEKKPPKGKTTISVGPGISIRGTF